MLRKSKIKKSVKYEEECLKQIKEIFKIPDFKEYQGFSQADLNQIKDTPGFSQADVIRNILRHLDTFAIIPTGGGKSICFQAPALFLDGITIVITPLVELIRDQVNGFNKIIEDYNKKRSEQGLRPYKAVYPGMDDIYPDEIFRSIVSENADGNDPIYCLLYLSPEKFTHPKFVRTLAQYLDNGLIIPNIVIDEVHCLSLWGFDFREDFLSLLNFIKQFPVRPAINAFTATVTTADIKIIEHLLNFDKSKKANRYSFFQCLKPREELIFMPIIKCCNDSEEESSEHKKRKSVLLSTIESKEYNNLNTIIYCTTVKSTKEIYAFLKNEADLNERSLYMYHGSMSKLTRSIVAEKFINSKEGCIMVATKAFGMGINKDDVSLIIHYDIPLSLEEYYQEAGRAARGQGVTGTCILLFTSGSKEKPSRGSYESTSEWVINQSSLKGLENTVLASRLSNTSRRILQSFHKTRFREVMRFINRQPDSTVKDSLTYSIDVQKYIIGNLQNELSKERKEDINEFLSDVDQFLYEVNQIHVANSKIANILRWHSDDYELNMEEPEQVHISEWKRNSETDYDMFIRTDISIPSVFIRIPYFQSKEEIYEYINQAWNERDKEKLPNAEVLYAVSNDPDLIVGGVYHLEDDVWIETPEDGEGTGFHILNKSVKRSLTTDRFPDWRSYDPENCLLYNGDYDFTNAFAYIPGKRERTASFSINATEKLTYFDMYVADVIYSLWNYGRRIYVKNIREILSGNINAKSSRGGSKIDTTIRESLEKLYNTRISISDPNMNFSINNERFLPFSNDGKNGASSDSNGDMKYVLTDTPPLYRYCEEINGEIIRINVSFFWPRKFSSISLYGIKPLMQDMTVFSIELSRIYYTEKNDSSDSTSKKSKKKSALVPAIVVGESIRRMSKQSKGKDTTKSNNITEQVKCDNDVETLDSEYVTFENLGRMVPGKIIEKDINEYEIYIKDFTKGDKDPNVSKNPRSGLKKPVKSIDLDMVANCKMKGITITEPEEINIDPRTDEPDLVIFKNMKTKQVLNLRGNGKVGYSVALVSYRYEENIPDKIIERTYSMTEKTLTWRSTIEDSVLFHYLLHRISIYYARKRGDFISFLTISEILDDYIPESEKTKKGRNLIYRKVLAYLCYLQRISYIRFYAYAKDIYFGFDDGKEEKGIAYYEVTHWPSIRCWRDGNRGMIQFADILLKWVRRPIGVKKKGGKKKSKNTNDTIKNYNYTNDTIKNYNYTNDTIIRLKNLDIDDLDGIRLIKKENPEVTKEKGKKEAKEG